MDQKLRDQLKEPAWPDEGCQIGNVTTVHSFRNIRWSPAFKPMPLRIQKYLEFCNFPWRPASF